MILEDLLIDLLGEPWGEVLFVVVQLFGLLTALSIVVLSLVWMERKFLGRIQRRMGPMRGRVPRTPSAGGRCPQTGD